MARKEKRKFDPLRFHFAHAEIDDDDEENGDDNANGAGVGPQNHQCHFYFIIAELVLN